MLQDELSVLLVEDSKAQADLICQVVADWQPEATIRVCSTLADARAEMQQRHPDLVIADLELPDGQALELLPDEPEGVSCPLVMLTSKGNEQIAVEAIKRGALEYLVKSADALKRLPEILERALRQWGHILARRKSETALRHSEERFRTVFNSSATPMLVISPRGLLQQLNKAACAFFGYSESDLLGTSLYERADIEDRDKLRERVEDLLCGKLQDVHFEHRYGHRNGRVLWAQMGMSCVRNQARRPLYIIGQMVDTTERKHAEEKLREANRELDAFVYTVSHDLRSPLTPIIGYADFLLETCSGRLDNQQLDCLQEITQNGTKMLELMEDLLALAKVGHFGLPEEPADTTSVVAEVVQRYAERLAALQSSVDFGPLPPVRVPRSILGQLFDILLNNAMSYGCVRGRPFEIGAEQGENMLRYYVRDHGPGISPEERVRIFELFYRGAASHGSKGTGIGLATVQKIVRLLEGRIWIEETPGGGATFWVELPA